MTGNEFLRRLRKLGRKTGTPVHVETRMGKGSHVRVYYGAAFTTLKDAKKELPPKTLAAMRAHLGLGPDEP